MRDKESGADPHFASRIETVLRRHGTGYRVTGPTYYTTGTAYANYARTNVVDEDRKGIIAVIPVRAPDVEMLADWDGMGQRMTASGGVVFTGVDVPAEDVMTKGYTTLVGRHGGTYRWLHLAAVAADIVRNIVADARRHAVATAVWCYTTSNSRQRRRGFFQQVVDELPALSQDIDVLIHNNTCVLSGSSYAVSDSDAYLEAFLLECALATVRTKVVVGRLALKASDQLFDVDGAPRASIQCFRFVGFCVGTKKKTGRGARIY